MDNRAALSIFVFSFCLAICSRLHLILFHWLVSDITFLVVFEAMLKAVVNAMFKVMLQAISCCW